MQIEYGRGETEYGPGVSVKLRGDEIASAITAYLVAHGVYIHGARTIRVDGDMVHECEIYVDPSGFVIFKGDKLSGRGPGSE